MPVSRAAGREVRSRHAVPRHHLLGAFDDLVFGVAVAVRRDRQPAGVVGPAGRRAAGGRLRCPGGGGRAPPRGVVGGAARQQRKAEREGEGQGGDRRTLHDSKRLWDTSEGWLWGSPAQGAAASMAERQWLSGRKGAARCAGPAERHTACRLAWSVRQPVLSRGAQDPVRIARFSIDGNVAFGAVEGDTAGRARPRHHQGHPVRGLRALRYEGPAEQGPAAAAGAPQQGRGLRPQLRGARARSSATRCPTPRSPSSSRPPR